MSGYATDAAPGSRQFGIAAATDREIACPAKGGQRIAAGRCVDAQDGGCFCPAAPSAIRGYEAIAAGDGEVNGRERVRLSALRARADGFMRQPEAKRFAGAGLQAENERRARAKRGEKAAEPAPAPVVPLPPVAPATPPARVADAVPIERIREAVAKLGIRAAAEELAITEEGISRRLDEADGKTHTAKWTRCAGVDGRTCHRKTMPGHPRCFGCDAKEARKTQPAPAVKVLGLALCGFPGCDKGLSTWNKSGRCKTHFHTAGVELAACPKCKRASSNMRPHPRHLPHGESICGRCRGVLDRVAGAPPGSRANCVGKFDSGKVCGRALGASNSSGLCEWCSRGLREDHPGRATGQPAAEKAPCPKCSRPTRRETCAPHPLHTDPKEPICGRYAFSLNQSRRADEAKAAPAPAPVPPPVVAAPADDGLLHDPIHKTTGVYRSRPLPPAPLPAYGALPLEWVIGLLKYLESNRTAIDAGRVA